MCARGHYFVWLQSGDTAVSDYDCTDKYFVSVVGAARTRILVHEAVAAGDGEGGSGSASGTSSQPRLKHTFDGHTKPITCLQV